MSEIVDIMRRDRCSWSEAKAKARASVPPVRSEPVLDVLRAVAAHASARRKLLETMGPMAAERADALYDLAECIDLAITETDNQ